MKTDPNHEKTRERRRRTPREEIITHLAWWWMGSLTPAGYARAHGIDPDVFARWIRSRLIFARDARGRILPGKVPVRVPVRKEKPETTATVFVEATVAGEGPPC